jgi:hypothetical protein
MNFLLHALSISAWFPHGNGICRDRLCGLLVWVPGCRSKGPAFDSQRYQIFWEVVGLVRGPISPVGTIEGLRGRNSSGTGLGNRDYCCGDPLLCPRYTQQTNSMVWVRERTIPTEWPPLVGEVIANFCGWRMPRGQRDGSLRPYSRFSRQEPLLFYQVAPQLYSLHPPSSNVWTNFADKWRSLGPYKSLAD